MGVQTLIGGRYRLLALAVLVPLLVCLTLVPVRTHLLNTSAALILVLAVVAVAAAGDRIAGAVAACCAGVAFDFFLTRPYERLSIASATDVQTTLLLLGVGLAVTEIAHWGYRQRATASRRAAYLEGIQAAARIAAAGTRSPSALVTTVGDQITTVLRLQGCRFEYRGGADHPRLGPDGEVRWHERTLDVEHAGLPAGIDTELPVESGGRLVGRYLLTPGPRTRPTHDERMVALALAAQAGAALRP